MVENGIRYKPRFVDSIFIGWKNGLGYISELGKIIFGQAQVWQKCWVQSFLSSAEIAQSMDL
jgi:hypothetical protein